MAPLSTATDRHHLLRDIELNNGCRNVHMERHHYFGTDMGTDPCQLLTIFSDRINLVQ